MSKLVKISQFNYPSEVINLINGQELFKIRASAKAFTTADVPNGVKMFEPEIVARINGQYINNWYLRLSESPMTVRIFPPYGGAGYKYQNKLLVSSGKYDESNVDCIRLALLSKALGIAVDFMIIAKLLDLDISSFKTDSEFIEAVKGKLGANSHDALDDYLAECHNQELVFNDPTEEPNGLIEIVRDNFKDYFKANPGVKTNKVYTFLGPAKQWISTKQSIKPIQKTLTKDGIESEFKTINMSLMFKLKTPDAKFETYCTKLVERNKLVTLTDSMMDKVTEGRINANFVCSVEIDLRKYKTGLTNSIKYNVSQFNYKPYTSQSAEIMLGDFDDDGNLLDDGMDDLISEFEHPEDMY